MESFLVYLHSAFELRHHLDYFLISFLSICNLYIVIRTITSKGQFNKSGGAGAGIVACFEIVMYPCRGAGQQLRSQGQNRGKSKQEFTEREIWSGVQQ